MKTVISFVFFVRQLLWRMRAGLSRMAARIAWRFLLSPQRYIWLRDVVLETPGGPVKLELVVVSTRGVFVVETSVEDRAAPAGDFERVDHAVCSYGDLARHVDEHARLVARALEEDGCIVRPVVVFTDPRVLPEERPSNMVTEFGLALYILSFKFHFYSNEEIQAIASRLLWPPSSPPSKLAA